MQRRLLAYAPAVAVFALDRITKWVVELSVPLHSTYAVIPNFFNLVHTRNHGAAFGILSDSVGGWRALFLIVASLVVLVFVAGFLWRVSAPGMAAGRYLRGGLSLVLGGALGNLYDRIATGRVTDFLELYAGEFHWPAFNVADSAITVGVALLVLDLWTSRKTASR
jgi:signal peptidase II